MWKKLSVIVLALVLVSLSVAAVASADSVAGSGWITADGAGRVCMTGNGDALSISGNGVLWYFDGGEEATPVVTGRGHAREFANGWVRWRGFHGTFTLQDADDVIVCLRGWNIHLRAEGTGAVKLTGRGQYETGGDGVPTLSGSWSPAGTEIQLGQ
jgi:hypothetical protein